MRYLPEFGWEVDVLTVKDISYYSYDPSLLAALPAGARVHRAGSLDPLRVHAARGQQEDQDGKEEASQGHVSARKLRRRSWPDSLAMDSGWNWTPHTG